MLYERRLFKVFARTAHNVILASAGAAFLQGAVAALGYKIAGVDQVIFLGVLTGLGAFIPLVGTTIVWIPIAIGVYARPGRRLGALRRRLVRGHHGRDRQRGEAAASSEATPARTRSSCSSPCSAGSRGWGCPASSWARSLVALFLALCEIYEEDFAVTQLPRSQAPDTAAPA